VTQKGYWLDYLPDGLAKQTLYAIEASAKASLDEAVRAGARTYIAGCAELNIAMIQVAVTALGKDVVASAIEKANRCGAL